MDFNENTEVIRNAIREQDYKTLINLCGNPNDILDYLYTRELLDQEAFNFCIDKNCSITSSIINKFILNNIDDKLDVIFGILSKDLDQCRIIINNSDQMGNLPLFMACENNKTDIAIRLIEIGADILVKDSNGNTALTFACYNENFKLINYFIQKDESIINEQNQDGNTVLHLASISFNKKLFKYLIDHGANFIITNKNNKKPLEIIGERYK